MRVAVIRDDRVESVIEAPDLIIAALVCPGAEVVDADDLDIGIGWIRDGEAWSPPMPEQSFPTLKRKELRNALVSIGIFAADVTAKISEIADPTAREFALIDWEDTQDYQRDHPLVDTLAVGFALPGEQVDALWRWAAGL